MMDRFWTNADVRRLLTGYYNRSDGEAREVVERFAAEIRLPEDPTQTDAAHWERLAAAELRICPAEDRALIYSQLALSRRLAELLGDGSHLDKLVGQTRDIAEGVQEATK